MSALEIIAVVLGVINVILIVRRNIWNYPFGLGMVALYGIIFFQSRLYSETGLQVFFFIVQIYGWWYWLKGPRDDGRIRVELLTPGSRILALLATCAGAGLLGFLTSRYTNAAAPYPDALVSGMSVTAQILLSRKKLENWILWLAVDVLAIGLYIYRGLYLTAGLYVLFLGLAAWGLVSWLKALRGADPDNGSGLPPISATANPTS